jgi:hypothetical protein
MAPTSAASKAPKAALLIIVIALVLLYLRFTSSEIEQIHAEQAAHQGPRAAPVHVEPTIGDEQPPAAHEEKPAVVDHKTPATIVSEKPAAVTSKPAKKETAVDVHGQQHKVVPYSKALIAPRKIAMLQAEAALLWRELNNATIYLEYGCGGSTYLSMRVDTISHIFSVESDKVWLGIVREDPVVAAAEKSNHLQLIHADIGPIKSLGKPADLDSKNKWPNYSQVQLLTNHAASVYFLPAHTI